MAPGAISNNIKGCPHGPCSCRRIPLLPVKTAEGRGFDRIELEIARLPERAGGDTDRAAPTGNKRTPHFFRGSRAGYGVFRLHRVSFDVNFS